MQHTILKEKDRHYIEDEQGLVAEMHFSSARDHSIIIDSTFVRSANRGQGLGKLLLDSVVDDARKAHKRIVPLCPFVKAQFEKHPEYQSML